MSAATLRFPPFHRAALKGDVQVLEQLRASGDDDLVDARDGQGRTALHVAARIGRTRIVRWLIEVAGAAVNVVSSLGETPLACACLGGHRDVVQLLLDVGATMQVPEPKAKRWHPLHAACQPDNGAEVLQLLLERGADVEVRSASKGWTALHLASRRRVDMVEVLLAHGAGVNVVGWRGRTPLHVAAATPGLLGVMRVLLERGAELEAKDKRGWTPLHCAVATDGTENVQMLLEQGADAMARVDGAGSTPLHHAAFKGQDGPAEALLQHGVEVDAEDSEARTPLQLAVEHRRAHVVRRLLEWGADRHRCGTGKHVEARTGRRRAARGCVTELLRSYYPWEGRHLLRWARHGVGVPLDRHPLFDVNVLPLVLCLMTGAPSPVFEGLREEAYGEEEGEGASGMEDSG